MTGSRDTATARRDTLDRILELAREHLGMEIAYVAEFLAEDQVVRQTTTAPTSIGVSPGTRAPLEETYCAHMVRGEIPQLVADTSENPVTRSMAATREAGIGAYTGVPVTLPDGSLYGTLCAVSSGARADLGDADVRFLRVLAGLVASEVNRELLADDFVAAAESLRAAVALGEITLFYQPKMDLASGRIASVEGLARWLRPDGTTVPPDQFIPLAEESGVAHALTEHVIEVGVAQAAVWLHQGQRLAVAVNVPTAVMLAPGFARFVGATLDRHGLAPAWLELEITESQLMSDAPAALGVLETLKVMGVRVSIDDFGTGYSSLSYLQKLPVHSVKIDLSFIRTLSQPGADPTLVRTMIDLAHNLGFHVVAEGVEDARTAALLEGLACDTIQGYWLSKPVPAESMTPLLDTDWLSAIAEIRRADADATALRLETDVSRTREQVALASSFRAASRAIVEFAVRAGATVLPAEYATLDAIPLDLSLGVSAPLLAVAAEGTPTRRDLERHLPSLVAHARAVLQRGDRLTA